MPRIRSTTHNVNLLLKFFATGAVLGAGLVAPNSVKLLGTKSRRTKSESYEDSEEFKRLVRHMRRLELIKLQKLDDGNVYVSLTDAGKTRHTTSRIGEITIPPQKQWDGKWRIITFDIPAGMKSKRYTFLHHLHRLGFEQALYSMWVYPFVCENEVYELARLCGLNKYMMIVTGNLTEDRHIEFAKKFSPLLKKTNLTY